MLTGTTVLPFAIKMSGWIYLASALVLDAVFLYYAWRVWKHYTEAISRRTFAYSILYLALLFAALLLDHYLG
jgi:protoheme IX farnesyltransferase